MAQSTQEIIDALNLMNQQDSNGKATREYLMGMTQGWQAAANKFNQGQVDQLGSARNAMVDYGVDEGRKTLEFAKKLQDARQQQTFFDTTAQAEQLHGIRKDEAMLNNALTAREQRGVQGIGAGIETALNQQDAYAKRFGGNLRGVM
jgi:hypothetical protein